METIYTDGSCTPNPGRGGWGFIIKGSGQEPDWEVGGSSPRSTNNQMELTAVIEALKFCCTPKVKLVSDSQYVINCAQGKWKRKINMDLWREFDRVSKNRLLTWEWVKAHNGDPYNERVDELARTSSR